MRHLLARLIGLCLLALLAAGCQRTIIYVTTPTSPAKVTTSAAERSAAITQIKGTVETRPSATGNWVPASQDQHLAEGSEVRTGPGSSAVIGLTEGSHLYLSASTQFTLTLLNPSLDSQLTTLDLQSGRIWVLLNGGALDVQTPYGIASARNAYLSVELQPPSRVINVTCLQGVCGFGSILIPSGYKLANAADNQSPEQMQMADYGAWGIAVPEATQLAFLATEAIAQGSATIPVVASPTASVTSRPTATPRPTSTPPTTATQAATATASPTPTSAATATLASGAPSPMTEAASETPTLPAATAARTIAPPTDTPEPSSTPTPSVTFQPTVTPRPFTPLPPAPVMGYHTVQAGETIFCIGRGYGVLPGAIAQANGLSQELLISAGQVLQIPAVQWFDIPAGPVCAPQFQSLFPGLPVLTATPVASSTPAGPLLTLSLNWNCLVNCGNRDGNYVVRVQAQASGGILPYTYAPAQQYDVTVPHCTTGQGTATVTSSDGQTAQASWTYIDTACPPK